jgi:hypothetical protein
MGYAVFLRNSPREEAPGLDHRLAPVLALGLLGILGLGVACCWVAYQVRNGYTPRQEPSCPELDLPAGAPCLG